MRYIVLAAILLAAPASASCIGSDALKSCYDDSGNNYTVSRLGNSTIVNGSNAQTGSTWNQTSNRYGNTTSTNGSDSQGRSWNSTSTPSGTYGTDASGKSFYVPH